MPRARANISAKLSAQIETGKRCVEITSAPAATSSPTMVKSSGRPAATRLPNAMTRMIIVTGHESISERSIAERLALLKFAQSALSPVSVTLTPVVESICNGAASASAALTISLVPTAEPAVMMAVRPSREIEVPVWGSTTVETRLSARSIDAALAMAAWAVGSVAIGPLWSTTTTCSAAAPSPEN
jgi:hypothetical protein